MRNEKSKKEQFEDELQNIREIVNKGNVEDTIKLLKWVNTQIKKNTRYRDKQRELRALKDAKKSIPKRLRPLQVSKGEIWLAELGVNVGSEQCGERPIIIVQNEVNAMKSPNTICIPLSKIENRQASDNEIDEEFLKKIEEKLRPTEVLIRKNYTDNHEKSLEHHSILLAQNIITISKERLSYRLSKISVENVGIWSLIEGAIKNAIDIKNIVNVEEK